MKLIDKITNTNTKTTVVYATMLVLAIVAVLLSALTINKKEKELVALSSVKDFSTYQQQLETLLRKDISASISVVAKDAGEVDATIQKSIAYPFLNGATVRFKNEGSPEVLVKNLLDAIAVQFPNNMALGKKLLSVDMRFRDKVYFGFEE